MEQDQMSGPAPQKKFNLWLIATIVLAVLLIASGVVFAWQKSVGDKTKNDLQSQINTLQGQAQQLPKIAPTNNTANCLKEGETDSSDPLHNPTACCAGLTQIKAPYAWGNDSSCSWDKLGIPWDVVCAYCGNGVCGAGENECNCPADCKTTDVTADWKTYTNTKYEFEIMYPSGWKFKESVSASGVWTVSFSDNQETDTTKISLSITSDSLLRKKAGSTISYEKYYDIDFMKQLYEEAPADSDISTAEISVNGLRALRHISYNPGNETKRIQVSIPVVNKMLILVVQDIATSTAIFDQMLATFKFTK